MWQAKVCPQQPTAYNYCHLPIPQTSWPALVFLLLLTNAACEFVGVLPAFQVFRLTVFFTF